jgi:hypothetical protein
MRATITQEIKQITVEDPDSGLSNTIIFSVDELLRLRSENAWLTQKLSWWRKECLKESNNYKNEVRKNLNEYKISEHE